MLTKKSLIPLVLCLGLLMSCSFLKKKESGSSAPATTTATTTTTTSSTSSATPSEAKPAAAASSYATPIDATKGFYDAVVAEKYDVAWGALTKASQDKFINMVADDEKMDPAKVRTLFEENQSSIQLGFWKSFRNSSKLDTVAPKATYQVLNSGPELAEVQLNSGDVVLKSKAIKENGQWRMGYVETFLPEGK